MNPDRNRTSSLAASPTLAGTLTILTLLVAVILSYNANRGLPFVRTYDLSIQVPDAAELVAGDDVRITGGRVGQVLEVRPEPGPGSRPPYAELKVALDANQRHLPVDTVARVRPRSILGSKYLELTRGRSGRTVDSGGTLPLRQSRAVVELDEAFKVFDRQTSQGLRTTIINLGDALAGRGNDLNDVLSATPRLMPPLRRVLLNLASPQTDLAGLLRGAAATAAALAAVVRPLGSVLDRAATTMAALDAAGNSLADVIEGLPPTEEVGTRTLRRIGPVLDDAAAIARALRPGTRLLPTATPALASAVEAGTPVLRRAPELARDLGGTLKALGRLAEDPDSSGAVRRLTQTVASLQVTLRFLNPAQIQCNVLGIWTRNVPSTIAEGDANGGWFQTVLVLGIPQMLQSAQRSPDLHVNYYPDERWNQCEAGNEPYQPGRLIGQPPGHQPSNTIDTSPPAGARKRAREAGLLDPTPGAHG